MSPLLTENKREKRRLDKEFFGDEIARRLNEAMPSPSVLRVRTLVERLKVFSEKSARLESFCLKRKLMGSGIASAFSNSPCSDYKLSDPEVAALAGEIKDIANEVSSLLKRYVWRPDVELNSNGTLRQVTRWPGLNEEIAWENQTVYWLISELPTSPRGDGPFAHFTHCERCGDWFYAGREGAKFCRPACRVMSHAQTNEGRAAKALYMRESRAKAREDRKTARLAQLYKDFQVPISPKTTCPKQQKGRI
jgi:hypothetical protein